MRVLWFTNTFVPGKEQSETATLRGSGSWMVALYEALLQEEPDLSLAVAAVCPTRSLDTYRVGKVDCFVVPMEKERRGRCEARALEACARIVNEWQPDLVHIHGTERLYGLLSARRMIVPPVVISLQGLLGPYSEWQHYFGNRSLWQIVRMHRLIEPFVMRGQMWDFFRYRRGARREREILLGNRYFLGRTLWDRAHLTSINPGATYYSVDEALRAPFWDVRWELEKCRRHRIVVTNLGHPRKGAEILFAAADVLRRGYPAMEVVVVGAISCRSGYGRYLRREIARRARYVRIAGPLTAREMAVELSQAHVFVSPSFIDNSPNAVCEAQLVGTPVIASYAGGVPSLMEDGKSGLFFPVGDGPCLAARIRDVFTDDGLACRLGDEARSVALTRHACKRITSTLMAVYEDVLRRDGVRPSEEGQGETN